MHRLPRVSTVPLVLLLTAIPLAGCKTTTKPRSDPPKPASAVTTSDPGIVSRGSSAPIPRSPYNDDTRNQLIPPRPDISIQANITPAPPATSGALVPTGAPVAPSAILVSTPVNTQPQPPLNQPAADVKPLELPPSSPVAPQPDNRPLSSSLAQAVNQKPVAEQPGYSPERNELASIKALHALAYERYSKLSGFEVRLQRKELVNNRLGPLEIIRMRFRKEPFSIYMKWIGDASKGREVVYVKGKFNNEVHILPAMSDVPLPIMCKPMSLALDSKMLHDSSRHDIREAGLGEPIRYLGAAIADVEKNPAHSGRVKYLGLQSRREYPYKLEAVEEVLTPDPLLPKGGKCFVYFDPSDQSISYGLPVIVNIFDSSNKEVEFYCYDKFLLPVRLGDEDFDPSRLGK